MYTFVLHKYGIEPQHIMHIYLSQVYLLLIVGRLLSVTACMFCVASVLTASFSGLVKLSIKSRVDIHMSKGIVCEILG